MFEISHRAMACDFVVMVRDPHQKIGHRSVADIVLDTLEEVDAIEQRLTVYQSSSEISAINQAAGGEGVCVSRETFGLLSEAQRLSEATRGAFDITAGPLVEAWGFTARNGRKPTSDEIDEARRRVGYANIQLDPTDCRVTLETGMQLNLGGIGKGQAIDRIASRLQSLGIKNFLIHAGQSSVRACGNQFETASEDTEDETAGDKDASPPGWLVGIAHPTKPNRRLAGIWLRDSALTTSGSGKQFFHHRGKRYGHVIDPRTGQPAGDLLSLSLLTDRAVQGDALATALFVMGREQALKFSEQRDPTLPLVMVAAGKRQDEVEVRTVGQWGWAEMPEGVPGVSAEKGKEEEV